MISRSAKSRTVRLISSCWGERAKSIASAALRVCGFRGRWQSTAGRVSAALPAVELALRALTSGTLLNGAAAADRLGPRTRTLGVIWLGHLPVETRDRGRQLHTDSAICGRIRSLNRREGRPYTAGCR
jgi:hypothetical protein